MAGFRISLSTLTESPSRPLVDLSPNAGYAIANLYLDAIVKHGKTEDQALADIKGELQKSFDEGLAFIEKTIRDVAR
jgi:hypothetical protein